MPKVIGEVPFEKMLAELQIASAKQRQPVEGFTMSEVTRASNKSLSVVQRMVRDAVKAGRAQFAGKRHEAGIDAVERPVPVYRLVKAK
jgi:hypothetical protein